jgi:hypothetical protein
MNKETKLAKTKLEECSKLLNEIYQLDKVQYKKLYNELENVKDFARMLLND